VHAFELKFSIKSNVTRCDNMDANKQIQVFRITHRWIHFIGKLLKLLDRHDVLCVVVCGN
jgi:hypothetical protein